MQTGRVNRRFLGIGALFVLGLGGAIGAVNRKKRASGAAPPAVAVRPAATAAPGRRVLRGRQEGPPRGGQHIHI